MSHATMLSAILLLIIMTTATATTSSPLIEEDAMFEKFETWKMTYGKQYRTRSEHNTRFTTFAQNLEFIENWNHEHTVADDIVLAMNRFGDLSPEEFHSLLSPINISDSTIEQLPGLAMSATIDAGAAIDFRQRGAVAPVLDQGSCGSCWAFAVVGMCEGANAVAGNGLVALSPQQLIDCSHEGVNAGCSGGDTRTAMQHVIAHGLERLADYPQTSRPGVCRYNAAKVAARFNSMVRVPSGNEGALASTLVSYGPVAVAMDSSTPLFQFYHSGIFRDATCSPTRLNHGMTLVGFTADSWIIKNSWGQSWGEQGFVRVARNRRNMCGVATYAIAAIAVRQ